MTAPERAGTLVAQLARAGFQDADRAAETLAGLGIGSGRDDVGVISSLAPAADPDLALATLARMADIMAAKERAEFLATLRQREGLRIRLFAVLGASSALGDSLVRRPADWRALAEDSMAWMRPSQLGLQHSLLAAVSGLSGRAGYDALRVEYRRLLLGLAARDLAGDVDVGDVAAELADLAEATLGAALQLAAAETGADAEVGLAVIGMGKCGGRELNYVSDVDVIFVGEPGEQNAKATALAAAMMRACSEVTAEGTIWPVDAALRPEGKSGPLVRTVASHEGYYQRWAHTWEFQALLKARPVAGDAALGAAYIDAVSPLVWAAAQRPSFVSDIQAMRRRVVDTLSPSDAEREIKLGPGGLRDVEFAVQLLQLVHGRADETLRSGSTLVALDALAAGGYVGRDDAVGLGAAYRFLRTVEHRLQLQQMRRTHLLPASEDGLRWLARAMGFREVAEWRRVYDGHVREVRRLHEKLFYRPLLDAVARLPAQDSHLSLAAAEQRLEALGFADPAAALRHLEALTGGVSRSAAILRTLLPAMLGWFADAADPDAGLLSFRQVSDSLGSTPWYLRVLRDEGVTAERLARLLATSRYVADLLGRAPEAVALLADDSELRPRGVAALGGEMLAVARRNDDWEDAVAAARALRRRELLRIGCGDLLGLLDVNEVGRALSDVTAATLSAALETAQRKVAAERRTPLPVRLAIIGMGRLGGLEQGYGSDADVLFVFEPLDADEADVTGVAHDVAQELRRLLTKPASDPPLLVDADLRPEGKQGPLVRSLGSYAEYYRRWSSPWEAQALLRAWPIAGDAELGNRFVAMIDPLRYPANGIADSDRREIRRLKARMEAERLPRGVDPAMHIKLGRGGLADVEWTVQLMQLKHAAAMPALRTTATLEALGAARSEGLMNRADEQALRAAWVIATRVRNAVVLAKGRPSDVVPSDARSLAAIARAMGYRSGHTGDLLEDYLRATRRARAVHERLFAS
ncbi:MAG TPA: bifunctional [glutamine synthetase] adenylyltransferase/[glutamine synthetase]-adenylyl-L-tyrosine phosphorylase [Mycobacteriales bacterium]|nr:bifunctional [glutamine synthetase] adenylyltransferase/[glutamine synthetase]-adenylyl-L-tyrosine phosphorylase [Mycobacteriales bacterium]